MSESSKPLDARGPYAAAHYEHYTAENLRAALALYRTIVATYPDAPEAGYARSQIQNIVNAVVPKQDYFAAQVDLASAALADRTGKPK